MSCNKNFMLKFILIFIIIQPLIDVVAGIMVRFQILPVSVGVIIRGVALTIMFFYTLFFSKSKNKGKGVKYTYLYFLFCFFYFVFKIKYMSSLFMMYSEALNFLKHSYFPLMLVFFIIIYDDLKLNFDKLLNIYVVNILIISFIIIIATITSTSFQSYTDGNKAGLIGWFYAANDISSIMAMLFPFLILKIYKTCKYTYIFLTVPVIYVMISIGTKVAFGGMVISIVILLIYSLFLSITKKGKVMKQTVYKYIIVIFIMVLFMPNAAIINNNSNERNRYLLRNPLIKNVEGNIQEEAYENNNNRVDNLFHHNKYITFFLSGRDRLLLNTYDIYSNTFLCNKLFGIGFTNRIDINDARINRSVEMDFFTILLRFGIIGFVIYMIPMVYLLYNAIRNDFKCREKSTGMLMDSMALKLSIILGLGISFLSGHVLGSPSVSIYLLITICMYFNYFRTTKGGGVNRV